MAVISGGDKLNAALAKIAAQLKTGGTVSVGFLSNATYPDGKPVAMVAAIQNFGAPARGIPPRPFFSNMVASRKATWPTAIENNLKLTGYNAKLTLERVGEGIAGQLRAEIVYTNDPPLAPQTVARKGFSKPLVDTGHMLNSVDYEVKT